jgi:hypothetical protein
MSGEVDKCVQAGEEFYRKAKLLKSPSCEEPCVNVKQKVDHRDHQKIDHLGIKLFTQMGG